MNVTIKADGKISNTLIATHLFKESRIIDRIVDFLRANEVKDISIYSNKDLNVKNTTKAQKPDENTATIDLSYCYDARKLKRILKAGKTDLEKAIMFKNEKVHHLTNVGCLYERAEHNPISQWYVERWGEKLAYKLRNTQVTPNGITYINTLVSIAITTLLFLPGALATIIFGLWIRFYHVLDVVDGQLARLKNQGSPFGKWLDGASDRIVLAVWFIGIAASQYLKTNNPVILFAGLLAIAGVSIYQYLMLTSVTLFRSGKGKFTSESKLKNNPLAAAFFFFLNLDVEYHLITIAALFNKLPYVLYFYAIYYQLVWIAYVLYYLGKHLKEGTIKEA